MVVGFGGRDCHAFIQSIDYVLPKHLVEKFKNLFTVGAGRSTNKKNSTHFVPKTETEPTSSTSYSSIVLLTISCKLANRSKNSSSILKQNYGR
jgi:hypothetical protein